MTTKIRVLPLCLLIPLCGGLFPAGAAAQSKVGTTAAQFLGIPVGARAIAMGGAYVAANQDVSSIYWNPGAVVQAGASEFAFVNTDWLVGTKFRWFGLVLNLDGDNAIGASVTDMDYGQGDVTTVASPEGTGETWSAADLAVSLYTRWLMYFTVPPIENLSVSLLLYERETARSAADQVSPVHSGFATVVTSPCP